MKKPVYYALIVALLLVFGFSAFMVVNYFIEGGQQADRYDELSQMASTPSTTEPPTTEPPTTEPPTTEPPTTEPPTTEPPTTEPPTTEPTEPTMIPGYESIYNMNADTVGWIRIDDTKINYPVMHTPDNRDYYLKRNFDRVSSDWGAIYIREECDINKPSDNITIYGHTMKDGSMFAALHNYLEKDYWQDHKLIYFDTLYEYHVYEIFAVFKTSANLGEGFRYHMMVDAESEEAFNDFISECKRLSFYDTGITPVYGDKTICLSTCEYTLDNGRLVVCARRVF